MLLANTLSHLFLSTSLQGRVVAAAVAVEEVRDPVIQTWLQENVPFEPPCTVCILSDGQRLSHRPGFRYLYTIPTPFGPEAIWVKQRPVDKPRPTPTVKTRLTVGLLNEPLLKDNNGAGTAGCQYPFKASCWATGMIFR